MLFSTLLVLSLASCKKDENPVPETSDDFWIYNIESDPQYAKLTAPYNGIVVTGGYKSNGILVYRLKIDNEIDDFVAYDRTCPYEASTCKMTWTSNDCFYCTCTCCKSKYNLVGEYMENGPSEYPMKRYTCEFIDGNLHIY